MEESRIVNVRIEVDDDTSIDTIENALDEALNGIGCDCIFSVEEEVKKVVKIYQPRMEITSEGETKDAWQDWGQFNEESEAIKVAEELLNDIKAGKYDDRLDDSDKARGYHLNACVEVLNSKSFELLYIVDVA